MALLSKNPAPKKVVEKSLFSPHWLFTIYLALVSFVAVVVMSVNGGILITSIGKYVLITDQEYILSDRAWEIKQCSEADWVKEEKVEKTAEEIAACEEKAQVSVLAQRSINLKETFIESLAWFMVFGLLFSFHYPKFLATREKKK